MKYKEEIKIEKGIPIPEKSPRWGGTKYPFKDMAVKDSFAVKLKGGRKATTIIAHFGSIIRKLRKFQLLGNKQFIIRKSEKEVRVWRTK